MSPEECDHPVVVWNIVEIAAGESSAFPAKVSQRGGCKVCGAAVQRDYTPLKVYRSVLAILKK